MPKNTFNIGDLELPAVAVEFLRIEKDWSYDDIARRVKCHKSTIFRAHTQGSEPMQHVRVALTRLARREWRKLHA